MKSLNKSIVLNKIRTSNQISRAQIAKDTNLTPPTVGSIVKELMEQGIVKESALGTSKGGRKPTMLTINHTEFFIIGVDAGPKNMKFILSDLAGNLTYDVRTEITNHITKDQFIEMLHNGIAALLKEVQKPKEKILGIGVAMHGVVDVSAGVSMFAPNLNLRDIAIKEELESAFDLKVKVENDARAMVLGEAWFGGAAEEESMLAVNVGRGVGAGLLINGRLFHGNDDLAGEVGHMMIDIDGKRCACGNKGCLQTLVSGPAIAQRAIEALQAGETGLPEAWQEQEMTEISGSDVYEAARQGNAFCRQILLDAGRFIGIGLTNLIHVMNPAKIVIGGGVSRAGDFILTPAREAIAERGLTPKAKQTKVIISPLADKATLLGAVALVLVELFDPTAV